MDDLFTRYIVLILALCLILGSGYVLWRSYQDTRQLNKVTAIEDASRFAESVALFRTFYSKTIVPKAREAGVIITHNFQQETNALPLPATFAKDFGEFLESQKNDYQVRLFSDKPFPWRVNTELDDFETWALKELTSSNQTSVSRIEEINGVSTLRFARADVLSESCVACHNNYEGTPKTDWKVGDLRGIFSISRPLASFETAAQASLRQSFMLMIALILGMLFLLFNVLRRLKNSLSATNEALEQTNRLAELKSEFLANMSHEIRTPMNGVIGMTEMLMDSKLNKEQHNLTKTVHESAESLLVIINDILDFSKIEAGKLTVSPQTFQLTPTLEAVMDLLADEAEKKQLNLALFIGRGVPDSVISDSGRLRQILINLLGNAIKFTQSGFVLLNVTMTEHGTIQFEVKDSGAGIPESAQKHLFDAFSQADGTDTRAHGGTGLGLAIGSQLVELLGGKLAFKSKVNEGSRFYFDIPNHDNAQANAYVDGKGLSALVYSPDTTLNRLYEDQLVAWNMQGLVVTTLNQYFSQLETKAFDVVAIDADNLYFDPEHDMGALKMVESIRKTSKAHVILFGRAQNISSLQTIDLGYGVSIIQKPIKHSKIQLLVNQFFITPSLNSTTEATETADEKLSASTKKVIAEEAAARPEAFNILLAEDNAVNQMVATTMLKKLGHQVEAVKNGEEAFNALAVKRFDIVLMDCQMPVLDGYMATKKIRSSSETHTQGNVPIIALTAHAMLNNEQKCFDAGMNDYLTKPIRMNELNLTLENWRDTVMKNRSETQLSRTDQ